MPIIKTWIPLTGRLLSRQNGGRGDPDRPVSMAPILRGIPLPPGSTAEVRLMEADWDTGQAYVEITAPQTVLDWLIIQHQLRRRGQDEQLPRPALLAMLARLGLPELDR